MASSYIEFGELISRYMKKLNISAAEVGRLAGFSDTHIRNLVKAKSTSSRGEPVRLPAETVDKIARVLGIPLKEAREAAGLRAPIPTNQDSIARLNAYASELDTYLLEILIMMAETLHRAQIQGAITREKPDKKAELKRVTTHKGGSG